MPLIACTRQPPLGGASHGLRGATVLIRRKAGYEAQAIANDIGMSLPMVMHYTRSWIEWTSRRLTAGG